MFSFTFAACHCNMPEKCVAKFCSNTPGKLISLHKFPEQEKYKRLWRNFVRTKRAEWTESAKSVLCSEHFSRECFTNYSAVSLGFQRKLFLCPDAVPTIHAKDTDKIVEEGDRQHKQIPASVRKRNVIAVSIISVNLFVFFLDVCCTIQNDVHLIQIT